MARHTAHLPASPAFAGLLRSYHCRRIIWWVSTPCDSVSALPKSVDENLPGHAQKIYMEAYNDAHVRRKNPEDRKGRAFREKTAHEVA